MESSQENLFDQAMARYQAGARAAEILPDFLKITEIAPRQAAVSYTHLTLPTTSPV